MRVSAAVNSEAMQGALLCRRSLNLSGLPCWRSAGSGAFLRSAGSRAVLKSADSGLAGDCRRLSWMALCKLASSSDSRRAICKNAASSAEELGATAKLGSLKLAWTSCSSSHHCDSSMASSDAPRPSTCQLNSRFRYAKRGLSLFLLFVFLALLERASRQSTFSSLSSRGLLATDFAKPLRPEHSSRWCRCPCLMDQPLGSGSTTSRVSMAGLGGRSWRTTAAF
mmetsp:Transcript_55646/g.119765  ORF Transcript_55646/g.119765 Transcript_55646/m.119765 type:complete len:224 (-) Transcript_55646:45-716(-)